MFELIKPGINIDWMGSRRTYLYLSTVAVVASIAVLLGNFFVRGAPVNYGTDFKGGSEIQVEFSKELSPAQVRGALDKAGFGGATVVEMSDPNRPHFFMLRMSEVSAFNQPEQEAVKKELNKAFGGKLARFDYKRGSDKVYLTFKSAAEVTPDGIDQGFAAGKIEVQQVQRFGKKEANTYEVTLAGLDKDIRNIFESSLGKGVVKDIPQVESVGEKMGKQLRNAGIKSVIYSLLLILLYIAIRFDLHFAPGSVVALFHDVIITVGVIAATWQEFSMTTVAALLTLAGYSINDTIVVYDRIRENVAKYRDRKFGQVINTSLNETLSRTLLTSLTTLFTSLAMYLIGTGDVSVFAFVLSFGIIIGTYSSIAVASPFTLYLNSKFAKKGHR